MIHLWAKPIPRKKSDAGVEGSRNKSSSSPLSSHQQSKLPRQGLVPVVLPQKRSLIKNPQLIKKLNIKKDKRYCSDHMKKKKKQHHQQQQQHNKDHRGYQKISSRSAATDRAYRVGSTLSYAASSCRKSSTQPHLSNPSSPKFSRSSNATTAGDTTASPPPTALSFSNQQWPTDTQPSYHKHKESSQKHSINDTNTMANYAKENSSNSDTVKSGFTSTRQPKRKRTARKSACAAKVASTGKFTATKGNDLLLSSPTVPATVNAKTRTANSSRIEQQSHNEKSAEPIDSTEQQPTYLQSSPDQATRLAQKEYSVEIKIGISSAAGNSQTHDISTQQVATVFDPVDQDEDSSVDIPICQLQSDRKRKKSSRKAKSPPKPQPHEDRCDSCTVNAGKEIIITNQAPSLSLKKLSKSIQNDKNKATNIPLGVIKTSPQSLVNTPKNKQSPTKNKQLSTNNKQSLPLKNNVESPPQVVCEYYTRHWSKKLKKLHVTPGKNVTMVDPSSADIGDETLWTPTQRSPFQPYLKFAFPQQERHSRVLCVETPEPLSEELQEHSEVVPVLINTTAQPPNNNSQMPQNEPCCHQPQRHARNEQRQKVVDLGKAGPITNISSVELSAMSAQKNPNSTNKHSVACAVGHTAPHIICHARCAGPNNSTINHDIGATNDNDASPHPLSESPSPSPSVSPLQMLPNRDKTSEDKEGATTATTATAAAAAATARLLSKVFSSTATTRTTNSNTDVPAVVDGCSDSPTIATNHQIIVVDDDHSVIEILDSDDEDDNRGAGPIKEDKAVYSPPIIDDQCAVSEAIAMLEQEAVKPRKTTAVNNAFSHRDIAQRDRVVVAAAVIAPVPAETNTPVQASRSPMLADTINVTLGTPHKTNEDGVIALDVVTIATDKTVETSKTSNATLSKPITKSKSKRSMPPPSPPPARQTRSATKASQSKKSQNPLTSNDRTNSNPQNKSTSVLVSDTATQAQPKLLNHSKTNKLVEVPSTSAPTTPGRTTRARSKGLAATPEPSTQPPTTTRRKITTTTSLQGKNSQKLSSSMDASNSGGVAGTTAQPCSMDCSTIRKRRSTILPNAKAVSPQLAIRLPPPPPPPAAATPTPALPVVPPQGFSSSKPFVWTTIKSMWHIEVSPYEAEQSAEVGVLPFESFKLLLEPAGEGRRGKPIPSVAAADAFGDELAQCLVLANCHASASGMVYGNGWKDGRVRDIDCGSQAREYILLCLQEQRIARGPPSILNTIIRELNVSATVKTALLAWKMRDDYKDLADWSGTFSYHDQGSRCQKCEIFVARTYLLQKVLKLESLDVSHMRKVNDCLKIMTESLGKRSKKRASRPVQQKQPSKKRNENHPAFTHSLITKSTTAPKPKPSPPKLPFRHVLLANYLPTTSTTVTTQEQQQEKQKQQVTMSKNQEQETTSQKEQDASAPGFEEENINLPPDDPDEKILTFAENELAWLCEECIYCFRKNEILWDFIWQHASPLLRVHLLKHQGGSINDGGRKSRGNKVGGANELKKFVRFDDKTVADRFRDKREEIKQLLNDGIRRATMSSVVAHWRLKTSNKLANRLYI